MQIDPEKLNTRDIYTWMVHSVLPRPIAWVSTQSPSGINNLAPFSFFNAVCARPPTLMFCPSHDRHGRPKDTYRNVEETREFVVNIAPWSQLGALNDSAASLPPDESEFERFGVESAPCIRVRAPRVAKASISFECTLDRIIAFSEGPAAGHAVFGRIVWVHVADDVLGTDGWPEAQRVDPIGRLGGNQYAKLGAIHSLERPL